MSKRKREATATEQIDGSKRTNKRAKKNGVEGRGEINEPIRQEATTTKLAFDEASSDSGKDKVALVAARREAKKQRRRAKKEQNEAMALKRLGDGPTELGPQEEGRLEQSSSKARREKTLSKDDIGWNVSEPIGGHLLDLDPIFSGDEQYLLLAYESSICIYSTATSTLVRVLRTRRDHSITGFSLSPNESSRLYVSTNSGLIEEWNWVKGERQGRWDISSQIYGLTAPNPGSSEPSIDVVYTIDKKSTWMITAHRLRRGNEATKTELRTLMKSREALTALKVLDGGKVVVATAGKRLMIGYTKKSVNSSLEELTYIWREVECSDWISSIDVRVESSTSNGTGEISQRSLSRSRSEVTVDIVLGCSKGAIYVYQDLLGKLIRKEKAKNSAPPVAERLHWHRNGIGSVKWSADGNYLISGGLETVMVLWQLDTRQKQCLPHLSAAIESVVVSPSGSSYAIRLANNSAMVLSTTELQPIISISGIQVPVSRPRAVTAPFIPSVDAFLESAPSLLRLPAAISPSNPSHLMLAVPAASASRIEVAPSSNAAYLQTFDVASSSQIKNQALTRTKVTHLNMGPESNVIAEPNVTLLQVSQDGKWLATVDEWMPPRRDVASMAINDASVIEEQTSRMEIYLKFWCWNDDSHVWELVSRMDSPHSTSYRTSQGVGRVLDLASDPSSTGFATFGADGLVRSWRPKFRYRDGIEVRGKDGKVLTSWVCQQATPVRSLEPVTESENVHLAAKLAFSADGSMLVVGYQASPHTLIHMIDTDSGEVRYIRPNLFTGHLTGLAIIDRYLILLSDSLTVWDLVNDQFHFGFALHSYGLSPTKRLAATHLAVDQQNHTFAIAIPEISQASKMTTKLRSQFAVFDPTSPAPLFTATLPHTTTSLLPAPQRKGYYAISSAAEVRILTPKSLVASFSKISADQAKNEKEKQKEQEMLPSSGLHNIFSSSSSGSAGHLSAPGARSERHKNGPSTPNASSSMPADILPAGVADDDDDVPVVRQQQLAEIFDVGPSYALPPIGDLFEQVVGLFVKKSKA